MKKSVVLTILLVYIASLAIVGFFGSKIIAHDVSVPVEDLYCLTDGVKLTKDSDNEYIRSISEPTDIHPYGVEYIYQVDYSEGLVIELTFDTAPENATNGGVEYSTDDTKSNYSTALSEDGRSFLISINKKGLTELYVMVRSKDKKVTKEVFVRVTDSSFFIED